MSQRKLIDKNGHVCIFNPKDFSYDVQNDSHFAVMVSNRANTIIRQMLEVGQIIPTSKHNRIVSELEGIKDGYARVIDLKEDQLKTANKMIHKLKEADHFIGDWLSAALEDPSVCKEMKDDINNWFATRDKIDKINKGDIV